MDNLELRKKIAFIDEKIIALVFERLQTAVEIGRNKKIAGTPVHDPEVEKTVIARYRRFAEDENIDPNVAEELAKLIISWSCSVQE
jgi:chorismate mutase